MNWTIIKRDVHIVVGHKNHSKSTSLTKKGMQIYQILHLIITPIFLTKHLFRIERNAFVSIWLYFSIVANVLMSLINFFPKQAWGSNYPDDAIPLSIVCGVFGVINIIAIIMLLNWRKSGFLLLTISSIIGGLLAMLTSSFPVGLLGIVVWYFILQIKKDGKSCWEQLS